MKLAAEFGQPGHETGCKTETEPNGFCLWMLLRLVVCAIFLFFFFSFKTSILIQLVFSSFPKRKRPSILCMSWKFTFPILACFSPIVVKPGMQGITLQQGWGPSHSSPRDPTPAKVFFFFLLFNSFDVQKYKHKPRALNGQQN